MLSIRDDHTSSLVEYHSIVELILVKIKLVSEFEHFQRLSI